MAPLNFGPGAFSPHPPELARRMDYFTLAPPAAPYIDIPFLRTGEIVVLPHPATDFGTGIGSSQEEKKDLLTAALIRKIIGIEYVVNVDRTLWTWVSYRSAQMILPFLYIGPIGASQDREFLRKNGFTLLLACRDAKTAQANQLSGENVAQELGIEAASVDVGGPTGYFPAFATFIRVFNDHLLKVHRQYPQKVIAYDAPVDAPVDQYVANRAKVLVYCESGNERSVCCVVAYIMSMYGMDVTKAVQLVGAGRFCQWLDQGMRAILVSFHGVLVARRDVRSAQRAASIVQCGGGSTKRAIGLVDFGADNDERDQKDQERFLGGRSFAPFSGSSAAFFG